MKKLIILILFLCVSIANAGIVKTIDYDVSIGHCSFANLKFAKEYGENFIIYADLLDADSTMIANNCYFLDTKAPFVLEGNELDSLLIWNPDYKPKTSNKPIKKIKIK